MSSISVPQLVSLVGMTFLALVALATALLGGYLTLLVIASRFGRRSLAPGNQSTRFAILVPAHDEALLINRLVDSLQQQDYPARLFDIFVVADNCSDDTARIAAEAGARVFERSDRSQLGKGFALRWLLQRIGELGCAYDAYLMFDADSVVRQGFLRAMDARVERGAQVVQGYYSVLNAGDSPLTMLRYAALASLHFLRPLAREAMGLSCGLKGNGMCFQAEVLHRIGWQWFTLAEDVEFHIALVREGIRVEFAADARVDADMPVSFSQAASQNERWERGRLQLAKHRVPDLLGLGIRETRWLRLDAAIEQFIPPMSIPFAVGSACIVAGLASGSDVIVGLAVFGVVAQLVHLIAGLVMVQAPRRAYISLAYAPVYIVWKLVLYGRALVSTRTMRWIRTARIEGESAALTELHSAAAHRDVA
jgi:1,2-diacylglycerol 3-beta-glucosyltransferase